MLVMVGGVLALTLWFVTIPSRGKHSSSKGDNSPGIIRLLWFFLAVCTIGAGYVMMATD